MRVERIVARHSSQILSSITRTIGDKPRTDCKNILNQASLCSRFCVTSLPGSKPLFWHFHGGIRRFEQLRALGNNPGTGGNRTLRQALSLSANNRARNTNGAVESPRGEKASRDRRHRFAPSYFHLESRAWPVSSPRLCELFAEERPAWAFRRPRGNFRAQRDRP